jgi:hypothetical protein
MSGIKELSVDQMAVLALVLRQGRPFGELAGMLDMDEAEMRRRAHEALDALGPDDDAGLAADRRAEVGDYLLGQQTDAQRAETYRFLEGSAPGRAWARTVSDQLGELASDPLPAIPDGASATEPATVSASTAPAEESAATAAPAPVATAAVTPESSPAAAEAAASAPDTAQAAADVAAGAFGAAPDRGGRPGSPRSSRLGGALLLGGLGIIVAVVLILIINGGGDDSSKKGSTLSSNPSTQTNAGQQRPIAQINLAASDGDAGKVGLAQVFQNGSRRAIIVAGQGLKPGAYALWLYNSKSDAKLLGFVPERVGKDGRFATQGELPSNAEKFAKLIVTKEKVTKNTKKAPSKPGTIVLEGDVKLG